MIEDFETQLDELIVDLNDCIIRGANEERAELLLELVRCYRAQQAEIERLNRINAEVKELLIDLTKLKKRLGYDPA